MQLTLDIHTDSGHGWLFVDVITLGKLGLSRGSFSKWSYHDTCGVYAEEDCDAGTVIDAVNARGYTLNYTERHIDGNHWIRNLPRCA